MQGFSECGAIGFLFLSNEDLVGINVECDVNTRKMCNVGGTSWERCDYVALWLLPRTREVTGVVPDAVFSNREHNDADFQVIEVGYRVDEFWRFSTKSDLLPFVQLIAGSIVDALVVVGDKVFVEILDGAGWTLGALSR